MFISYDLARSVARQVIYLHTTRLGPIRTLHDLFQVICPAHNILFKEESEVYEHVNVAEPGVNDIKPFIPLSLTF